MNWEAVSAIGQIIGAIAVVVTLLYLAKDVRDNSRALAVSSVRDTTEQWNNWGALLASSPDLAEIVAKGNRSLSHLSETEALRYGAFVQSFFDIAENYRRLVAQYKIDRDIKVLATIVARRLEFPGFAEWWDHNTQDYEPGFVAWVEAIRSSGLPRPEPDARS